MSDSERCLKCGREAPPKRVVYANKRWSKDNGPWWNDERLEVSCGTCGYTVAQPCKDYPSEKA